MKTYKFESYGKVYDIYIEYSTYENNDSLAVILNTPSEEEGFEGQLEEFAVITVNLNESWFLSPKQAYIDTNNVEGIEEFLTENKIACRVKGRTARSGWCEYPLYQFASIKNEE